MGTFNFHIWHGNNSHALCERSLKPFLFIFQQICSIIMNDRTVFLSCYVLLFVFPALRITEGKQCVLLTFIWLLISINTHNYINVCKTAQHEAHALIWNNNLMQCFTRKQTCNGEYTKHCTRSRLNKIWPPPAEVSKNALTFE